MKVFIYGAGASKGSQVNLKEESLTAPLTDELFSLKYANYAHQVRLGMDKLEDYREKVKGTESLEKWLTDWWSRTQSISDENLKRANLGKFGRLTLYLWWLLYKVSWYSQVTDYDLTNKYVVLVRKLVEREEAFGSVSFNYDTLLDKAIDRECECDLYGSLDNYIKSRLIKPHGSVNWFINGGYNLGGTEAVLIDAASKAVFNNIANLNGMQVFSPFHPLTLGYFSSCQVPLMLMPLTTKLYPYYDEFYKKMLGAGTQLLAQAKEIYVIGYQAQDEIIRNLFKEVKEGTTIHVVSNRLSTAETVMERVVGLTEGLVRGDTIEGGFAKFCDDY